MFVVSGNVFDVLRITRESCNSSPFLNTGGSHDIRQLSIYFKLTSFNSLCTLWIKYILKPYGDPL